MSNWEFSAVDQALGAELSAFLPARVYDAHAHLYRRADLHWDKAHLVQGGPEEVGLVAWQERVGRQVGAERLSAGLFCGFPSPEVDLAAANEWVLGQVAASPDSRGLLLARPGDSPETLAPWLDHPQVAGLKPYHLLGPGPNTFELELTDYAPEWMWQLAHDRGWVLLLHLVKSRALADPGNQAALRDLAGRYPGARVVLAHCARGFHGPHTEAGLPALSGLQNVWFDTSGICEARPLGAILRAFGPRRLLWGSDFPVSEMRGKCLTAGDGFAWVDPTAEMVVGQPALVGLEALRALQEAGDSFGLNAADWQDIFERNARRLLGLEAPTTHLTRELYDRAKRERIPGGVQLRSKLPELQAPDQWPAYFREARGCEVWDLDGRHYYDMSSNGIGACLLGFRDPDVTRAVQRRINLGSMSSLNPPEEVELADRLCALHPWAEQARFARCGGEIGAVAVRIARATTDRSVIAVCGYHGWQDWYIAANLGESDALRGHLLPGLDPLGVPRELRDTTVTFPFNDRAAFQAVLDQYGSRLAAVIMEPCRHHDPEPGFLETVRDGAHRAGALLIFDEITIGFRLHRAGSHLKFGVNPDMAIFAKALGNGHPVSAVIGTAAAMEGAHYSFISSTYWTESVGPTAALATLDKLDRIAAPAHAAAIGAAIIGHWRDHGLRHGLPVALDGGYPCLAHFAFQHELANELKTLYTQLMLARGFLASTYIYPTMAHTPEIVAKYGAAIDEVFGEIAEIMKQGTVEETLQGPPALVGFRRLN